MKTDSDYPQDRIPKPMERYQHFRGGRYQVLVLAEQEDTGEQLVIYQALYGDNKVYARSLSSFLEELDPARYPDAVQRFRFRKMEEEMIPSEHSQEKERQQETSPEEDEAPKQNVQETVHADENEDEEAGVEVKSETAAETEPALDPMLERFLDARTTQERLTVLDEMRGHVTDAMIDTMAMASDVEVKPGPLQLRYEDLHDCLLTIQRYELERSRLRG